MLIPWLIIATITFSIAFLLSRFPEEDRRWFFQLKRPSWLTFEALIPFIWISIFLCGITSATLVWLEHPFSLKSYQLLGGYLFLELIILAYTPLMSKYRSLYLGTILGGTGWVIGIWLAKAIFSLSFWAVIWLLPYLLWSPIGTYVTWEMAQLNPDDQ